MEFKKTFFLLAILSYGLVAMAQTPKPVEDLNKVTDLTLDSLDKVRSARIKPGTSRQGRNPVLFLIGNSTMRNGTFGNGNNGQWGWGYFAQKTRSVLLWRIRRWEALQAVRSIGICGQKSVRLCNQVTG